MSCEKGPGARRTLPGHRVPCGALGPGGLCCDVYQGHRASVRHAAPAVVVIDGEPRAVGARWTTGDNEAEYDLGPVGKGLAALGEGLRRIGEARAKGLSGARDVE